LRVTVKGKGFLFLRLQHFFKRNLLSMNFSLSQLPERISKPRSHGITMVMDKGLSIEETRNFLSISAPYVDVVKLGFGTAYVTPDLDKKLDVYRSANIPIYFGGHCLKHFSFVVSWKITSGSARTMV
jgi:phosphosulfolactate synthase (CoM biosynthesis protein A)